MTAPPSRGPREGIADDDPSPLRARERREASRALKGRPLRQEVSSASGTLAEQAVPYTVAETCFTAARLQRADDDTHGFFRVTPLQTLTTHYERDADDPRIMQERTLDVDDYGTVTRAVTVIYPRRAVTSPGHGRCAARGAKKAEGRGLGQVR